MYICVCNGITDREIRCCVEDGARSLRDLETCLGVGAGCGKCKPSAREVLREAVEETRSAGAAVLTPA